MKALWAGALAATLFAGTIFGALADTSEPQWRTASSLIGEPKYPADFKTNRLSELALFLLTHA